MFANPALVIRKGPSVELVPPPTDGEIAGAAIEKNEEIMGPRLSQLVGKRMRITGQHHLCGYRGVVLWCNEILQRCGLHLEANNQWIIISPGFLIDSDGKPQM